MHYLTILGMILIFLGTYLTYYGQNISSKKDKDELISTINNKDEKIISLKSEVKLLRENDERIKAERDNKVKTIALRANQIFTDGNMFFSIFFAQQNQEVFTLLMKNDFSKNDIPDEEIIENVKKVFMSVTMLEPSTIIFDPDGKPYSSLGHLSMQLSKMYQESNLILQHYGDIDHEVIEHLDDIRRRAEELLKMIPLLKRVSGGIQSVFGEGVPEQWAEYFTYYYLALHKCELTCDKILHKQ